MANIQVFEYRNSKVRTVDMDGEAWFVLKDVCAVLGISNNRMAADRLDDDEKGVSLIDTLGGKQEMVPCHSSQRQTGSGSVPQMGNERCASYNP